VLRARRGGQGHRGIGLRLQLRGGDRIQAGAGAFELLRVIAVQHPMRASEPQRQEEVLGQACGFLAWPSSAAGLRAVADAARRGMERGGSVYLAAASPIAHRAEHLPVA
jgi:hypothetical protein